jgi:hypothetical protein
MIARSPNAVVSAENRVASDPPIEKCSPRVPQRDGHAIRLRGPWRALPRAAGGRAAPAAKFQWPAANDSALPVHHSPAPPLGRGAADGDVAPEISAPEASAAEVEVPEDWLRVFHRPSGLSVRQPVWLELLGLPPLEAVWLNGQRCTAEADDRPDQATDALRWEVGSLLAFENELRLQPCVGGRPRGLVRLWIEAASRGDDSAEVGSITGS